MMLLERVRSMLLRHDIDITLMSRPGCSLCEKAERAAVRVCGERRVRVVNILDDRALEDAYVFRIPVLLVDGVEAADGIVTERDVRRAVRNAVRRRATL